VPPEAHTGRNQHATKRLERIGIIASVAAVATLCRSHPPTSMPPIRASSFGPCRIVPEQWSDRLNCYARMFCLCRKRGTRMKKTITSAVLSLAFMSSAAMANDRAGAAVSGTLSAIGHAARKLVGSIAEPFSARSRGSRRSSAAQEARRVAGAEPRSHLSDSPPPAARSQTDAPKAAPPVPMSTSAAPPVQPLE
jgi:hypothetical protein